ncbi:substrate-binding domain-containing protein [Sediminispirochaeta bajacaliforniensis]|uniref:substrate-binding domain-containing protein n=1 Tax=Sediminispirochaeta bajacaliforniensis TaxID=148 RepID=UPI00036802CD|nr:substrate-binding domain-containing protein [Sediminispirochaeta bajacaliforniensis]
MKFLTQKGVKIPEDISLVGFDDNLYAKMTSPALTTMRQDVREKGQLAIQKLLRLIKNKEITDLDTRLESELIIRDSVKKRN